MDPKATATALAGVHNLTIQEAALLAHVMRPPHVVGIISSKGLQEGTPFPEAKGTVTPSPQFDVKGFGEALHAALKDSVVGYVMRLGQDGVAKYTLEWNWAQTPDDGGKGWTPEVRMHIASCSKLITGIAMTKLLNDKGLSYDTPTIGYLPTYWVKGLNIDKITFRHLMTHTSGFNTGGSNSDYQTMKSLVAAGVNDHGMHKTGDDLGYYRYENMNFGLCRILIATINGNVAPDTIFSQPGGPIIPNYNDLAWDYVTIQCYVQYVRDHVFMPAGVSGPSLDHPLPDALAYTFPVSGNGWNSGDLSTESGGAGWHMSVDDLLDVMGAFRRKGTIMSTTQAQAMLDNGFGIDLQMSTPLGTLYNKNGLWGDGVGRTEQSLLYFLPQDMELVVLANSPVGAPAKFFRDAVTKIYLANIK